MWQLNFGREISGRRQLSHFTASQFEERPWNIVIAALVFVACPFLGKDGMENGFRAAAVGRRRDPHIQKRRGKVNESVSVFPLLLPPLPSFSFRVSLPFGNAIMKSGNMD